MSDIFTPLKDQVLVDPIKRDSMKGGIHLPDQSMSIDNRQGRVIRCGSGCVHGLKPGDIVLIQNYGQQSVVLNNKRMWLVKEEQIMAIVERD